MIAVPRLRSRAFVWIILGPLLVECANQSYQQSLTSQEDARVPHKRRRTRTNYSSLVKSSFGVMSDTLGTMADGLRITGDTMGGVMSSSIKIVGAAVKSAGSTAQKLKPITSHQQSRDDSYFHQETSQRKRRRRRRFIVQSSRRAAAKTFYLMGQVVQELGDVLILTGAATESIAGLSTSLAEDSIRLLETMTANLARREEEVVRPRRMLIRRSYSSLQHPYEGPTVSYGIRQDDDTNNDPQHDDGNTDSSSILNILFLLLNSIHMDTGGVPSQAPELLVVFLLCFGASIAILKPQPETGQQQIVPAFTTFHKPHKKNAMDIVMSVLLLPLRFLFIVMRLMVFLIWNRYTLLLVLYMLAWMHACRLSQLRSQTIHSGAEAHGYRHALESLQHLSTKEPTQWLNNFMTQHWRVASPTCPPHPSYVLKGIPGCRYRDRTTCFDGVSCYGGIEPYLSSVLGDALSVALDNSKTMHSRNIAYASLLSISLGNQPPLIRYIQTLYKDATKTEYLLELDLQLTDLRLVLDLKLTSLDYAFLPSTQVAITSIQSVVTLKIVTYTSPAFPFVSRVELSLQSLPDVKCRIVPISNDSGLKGVDLGSLPLIRDWIQEVAIRQTMKAYVSPRYVSLDLSTAANRSKKGEASFADLEKLYNNNIHRQHQWRTTTATTSRRKNRVPRGPHISTPPLPQDRMTSSLPPVSLIRPKTTAAKLGMERWIELQQQSVAVVGS